MPATIIILSLLLLIQTLLLQYKFRFAKSSATGRFFMRLLATALSLISISTLLLITTRTQLFNMRLVHNQPTQIILSNKNTSSPSTVKLEPKISASTEAVRRFPVLRQFPYDEQVQRLNDMDAPNHLKYTPQAVMPKRPAVDVKYFREHPKAAHLDRRFAPENLPAFLKNQTELQTHLSTLIDQFFQFMNQHHAVAWLAHGSLIGWYWSQRSLPWDDDVDVQMTFDQLQRLYPLNNTRTADGRYLFDINPNCVYRWPQWMNTIDARFIDTQTGLYVDITALAEVVGKDGTRHLACKSPHYYRLDDIFPTHPTTINGNEGTIVMRPNRVIEVLTAEYGIRALVHRQFRGYQWSLGSRQWEKLPAKQGKK
jgi:hypothetical protein